jgi:ketosteroid isomerase-like protein
MRGWIASFDSWEPTIERVIDAGDEVITIVRDRAYLQGSTVPVTRRFAHSFTFRDGQIVRCRLYSEPAEALEAVGLSE